jgi:hypothetical protein
MEDEYVLTLMGLCLMLGAILLLFHYKGKSNSARIRTIAFVVLLVGEGMLFPWDSPLHWLKAAVLAGVNYMLGSELGVFDGVLTTLSEFLHQSLGPGGPPSGAATKSGVQMSGPGKSKSAPQVSSPTGGDARISWLQVLRRMLWPDLPLD